MVEPPGAPAPILVVDDDADIREALREMLAEEGYEIGEAQDGLAALEWLREHDRPSLILLDWNMGRMGGAEFMEALAKERPGHDIPIVLLTADLQAAERAKRYTFGGYLKKPIDFDAFFSVIERYCGER